MTTTGDVERRLLDLCDDIVRRAQKKGADASEAYAERATSTSAAAKAGPRTAGRSPRSGHGWLCAIGRSRLSSRIVSSVNRTAAAGVARLRSSPRRVASGTRW